MNKLIEFINERFESLRETLFWIEENTNFDYCDNPDAYDDIADLNCIIDEMSRSK